jgi:Domain of unknown function (DUF3560)/Large polyvalent protein associated domain 29
MITSYNSKETAKFIRTELKGKFPGIKFSVTSGTHTVNISWLDGPTREEVERITNKFGGMSFDGMQDLDTYSKKIFNGEEVQFYCYSPYTKRKLSMEFAQKIKASMERQGFGCPSIKEEYGVAVFQTQEMDSSDAFWFRKESGAFTPENIDTLNLWGQENAEATKGVTAEEQQDGDLFQLDLEEILAARREMANGSVSTPSRELVTVGASEQPAESEAIPQDGCPRIAEVLELRRQNTVDRQERRSDRLYRLASKHRKISMSSYQRSQEMTSGIPLGQPILIGHHSEGRHRRLLARSHRQMDKCVQAQKTADYYEDKIVAMESNTAIAADDPDAIKILKIKLAQAEGLQEQYKLGNKIVRDKKMSHDEKVQALKNAGHDPAILTPPHWKDIGYPHYKLTNNNANIKRMRDRLAGLERQLQKAATAGTEDEEHPELGLRVVRNHVDVRLQLFFDGKPSEQVRATLKAQGFKWAPSISAWQRQLTGNAEFALATFLNSIGQG